MQNITIAAVNFHTEFGNIDKNLKKIEKWISRLVKQGAELIVFPELAVCGYDNTKEVHPYSQSIPGPATDTILDFSAKYNVTILTGLSEIKDDNHYISHIVADKGKLIGIYRKTHPGPSEKDAFTAGDRINVFTHEKCNFGIQICYDSHFPEVSSIQALKGADIIFIVFASPRDEPERKRDRLLRYLSARAYDNSCYIVSCNLTGKGNNGQRFGGVALAIDPKGEIISESVGWKEGYILFSIDGEEISRIKQTRMGHFLSGRRPELYQELTKTGSFPI